MINYEAYLRLCFLANALKKGAYILLMYNFEY